MKAKKYENPNAKRMTRLGKATNAALALHKLRKSGVKPVRSWDIEELLKGEK